MPLLSALLLLLSFPPLHLGLPPFVALVPFAVHLESLESTPSGSRRAAGAGLLLGAAYFGVLLYWIAVALLWATPLAVPAYLATVAVLSSILGLAAWALHTMRRGAGIPLWLALPLAWTGAEWLRAHLPGGLAFPWLGLGTSLTGYPEVVGMAEVVGARGVTFWLALTSGLGAEAVVRARDGRGWLRTAGAAVLVVALPAGWGVWRANTLETRPAGRIAVVQPDLPAADRSGPGGRPEAVRRALVELGPRVEGRDVELVVWPESVLLEPFPDSVSDALLARLREHARRAGGPVLVGARGLSREEGRGEAVHNSAFLVGPDGVRDFAYHKRRLVPLVERRPFPGIPWPRGAASPRELTPGAAGSPGRTGDGTAIGVLICFESAFASLARTYRMQGADVLVNMTNDAWFGREPWHARTPALWQHPAHLVMRAIETRAGVARAAATGISLFVDPVGRIHGRTSLFREAVGVRTVRTTDVLTVYARLGDWFGPLSAATVALLVAWVRIRNSAPLSSRLADERDPSRKADRHDRGRRLG